MRKNWQKTEFEAARLSLKKEVKRLYLDFCVPFTSVWVRPSFIWKKISNYSFKDLICIIWWDFCPSMPTIWRFCLFIMSHSSWIFPLFMCFNIFFSYILLVCSNCSTLSFSFYILSSSWSILLVRPSFEIYSWIIGYFYSIFIFFNISIY